MQPKIRGTYSCGKCGNPKIRPHKCPEPAVAVDGAEKPTVAVKSEEVPAPLTLQAPTFSEEPPPPGEFCFRSRRNAHVRSLSATSNNSSTSSLFDEATTKLTPPLHSRSLSDAHTLLHSPPRPPAQHPLSRSLDSPVRTVAAGPRQVIRLIAKSPVQPCAIGGSLFGPRPEQQIACSSSLSEAPISPSRIPQPPLSQQNGTDTDDSSTSSIRKRLLSPKSAAATTRSRGYASKPRLAPLPVLDPSAPSVLSLLGRDQGSANAAAAVATTAVAEMVGEAMAKAGGHVVPDADLGAALVSPLSPLDSVNFHGLRQSLETDVPLFHAHHGTLQRTASYSSNAPSASDLSDESSMSEEDDTPRSPRFAGSLLPPPLLPAGFPTWGGSSGLSLPPTTVGSVQMLPFYTTVDQYGRQVVVPCWMPPSSRPATSAVASAFAASSSAEETVHLPVCSSDTGASSGDARKARPRRPRTNRSATSTTGADTATADGNNIVTPVKARRQPSGAAAAGAGGAGARRRKKASAAATVTETPTNTAASVDHYAEEAMDTLDEALSTLASAEIGAELDGTLDAFALELEGFGLHQQGGADEEEDLFQYLHDDPLVPF